MGWWNKFFNTHETLDKFNNVYIVSITKKSIDESNLFEETGCEEITDLTRLAFTLLRWVADQKKMGRSIVSLDETKTGTDDPYRIAEVTLSNNKIFSTGYHDRSKDS